VAASLRSFAVRDRPAVLELSRRAINRPQEQLGNPVWTTMAELESELAAWEPPAEETLLVDEQEGEVAAFAGVEIAPGFAHADLFGPLVAPAHRGQRLGALLLDAAIEKARDHAAGVVIGSVGTQNAAGRMLLERRGFRTRGPAHAVMRLVPAHHRSVEEPPSGVHVRRGTGDDLPDALRLYRECFPGGGFPDSAWRRALEDGTVYLAEDEGRPVAIVNIDESDRWVYHVGVVEGERARGVGAFLLSEALADYWRSHADEVLGLSVQADNVPALRLYRRQGFAPWLVLQHLELEL
jgi:ribosomal protein S18 acetylase RimI-like enzyme